MLRKSTRKLLLVLPSAKQYGSDSSIMNPVKSNNLYTFFSYLFAFLILSISSSAQITDPRVDCTNGCTSNDVQIIKAYLTEPNSPYNPLTASFQCQGSAQVKLALDLTTKTPRVGVFVFARVVNKNNPAQIYATVSECFSTALASGGITKVVFNQAITWPCGAEIVLKDVFIGWGTGNTDFCQGSATPRCPATPSKCYSLPPGEYITVVIPTANTASATLCSDQPGGTTATFNLTSLNATVTGSQQNVTVTWFTDAALTNQINPATAFVSGTATVYTKVSNNADPTAYQSSSVSLTVNRTPTATTASSTLCSSAAGGTTASFNLSSLETTIINGQSNVAVSWFSNAGLSSAISSPYVTGTTTVYAKVTNTNATSCYSSVAINLTVNRTPTATAASSTLCSTTAGGTTASFNLSGLETTVINGQSNVAVTWFSNSGLSNAISSPYVSSTTTVYAKVTNTNATSCFSSVGVTLTVNSRPGAITADVVQPTCGTPTGTITVTSSKSGLTFSLNSSNPADFTNSNGVFGLLAPGSYTIRSKTTTGCISDALVKEVLSVPSGTPAADVVIQTNPTCSSSTGTLKVVQAGSNADYDNTVFEFSNNGGSSWTSNPVFSFTAGAGYSITVRRISDHTCTASTSCQGESIGTVASPEVFGDTRIIAAPQIGIKTIPNPFNDRVRFAVTLEESGIGSLDVFNMQGQKIKTVYSGYVKAGTNFYELELPAQSSGQLIYIFRIGNQKYTGKLMQIK